MSQKTGFACGVFDLFHPGHVLMLKECKSQCDYLIVALNRAENLPSHKNQPIFSLERRKLMMESCVYVDEVLDYNSEEELLELMQKLPIDVRFLGEDYRGKEITGPDLPFEIYYTDRSHGLSTSGLIREITDRYCKPE
ncbi:MAG: adenylyltransferase/cytidyltransferase family protein [Bacteroidia bacterium]|nr:adenylyltransferase/cytidyltransferase family protein [Bacteroidia bacterium]